MQKVGNISNVIPVNTYIQTESKTESNRPSSRAEWRSICMYHVHVKLLSRVG